MNLRDHLLSRGMDPDEYRVALDEENCVATFLLFTLSGKLAGYQQYRPLSTEKSQRKGTPPKLLRYFIHQSKVDGKPDPLVLFGLEKLDIYKRDLYVVEGAFDAVALHNLGLNAVAVLCNNPVQLKNWLYNMQMNTIAVVDGDKAGLKLGNSTERMVVCPEGMDPASMSVADLKELIGL